MDTHPNRWLLPLMTLGLWALFLSLGVQLIQGAPPVWLTERLIIQLQPGQSVDLGRASLGLTPHDRTTTRRHLRIQRDDKEAKDKEEGIRFFNLSPLHRVDARTERYETRFLNRMPLSAGDSIQLGERRVQVEEADPRGRLVLTEDKGDRAVWEEGRLRSERRAPYEGCGAGGIRRVFKQLALDLRWRLRERRAGEELALFSLGGQVPCADRWALEGVTTRAAHIYWRDGQFLLGDLDRDLRELIGHKDTAAQHRLADQGLPLNGPEGRVQRLVLGRTHFRVLGEPGHLILEPAKNIPLAFEPPAPLEPTPGLEIQTRTQGWVGANPPVPPSPLRAGLFVFFLLLSLPAAALLHAIERHLGGTLRSRWAVWLGLLPAWGLLGFALTAWDTLDNNLATGLALCAAAWLLASLQWWRQGRLAGPAGLPWLLLMALAGFGALNLAQLAAGAYNTKWLGYASGHLAILTGMAAATALAGRLPPSVLGRLAASFAGGHGLLVRGLKAAFLGLVLSLAFLQFLAGDEKGLGWVQPVEFVKLILVFMLASSLTHLRWMRLVESRDYRDNRLRWVLAALWLVAVFVLASAVLMLGVNDYSPLVIVLAVILPFLWLAFADPHIERLRLDREGRLGLFRDRRLLRRAALSWLLRGLLAALLLGGVLAGLYLKEHPPGYQSDFPQVERLRIWSDPWTHRLSGDQIIQSLLRVREGGWTGVGPWFGPNAKVMNLPAVQDDFIAAFLIHRFGALAAMLLAAVQTLWALLLLRIARRLMTTPGEFEEHRARYWLGAVITGLTWMLIAHWTISWGNVLGLLPVMGQPMSWLSSGNSHMLAIAFPAMLLGLAGAWMAGERGRG